MRVVSDWRWVLRRAWSIRWIMAAALFAAIEGAIGVATALMDAPPLGIPPGLFAGLSGLASAGALVTRFIAQRREDE